MHTRTDPTDGLPHALRPPADPQATRLALMNLLSEQVAIPLDQVARFLDTTVGGAARALQRLEDDGCLEHRRFLVRDHPWFWLSYRGAGLASTGFHYKAPDVSSLAHRRALNEVRLYLAERAPEGRWLCERIVYRQRDSSDHIPDAIFEIDGERHAIEVELSSKRDSEIRRILTEHSNRYDAVLYFCGPYPYRLLQRLQGEGRWPKLVVRRLPEVE